MTQTLKSPGACHAGAFGARSISQPNANEIAQIVSRTQVWCSARRFDRSQPSAKFLVELAGMEPGHD